MKRISLPWFSIAFSVAYVVVFALDLSLFLYYPLVKEIHLMPQGEALGPAMHVVWTAGPPCGGNSPNPPRAGRQQG